MDYEREELRDRLIKEEGVSSQATRIPQPEI
jgi:hypothetical protein